MNSIGLDTSVVVRFLTGKPDDLAETARDRISTALQEGYDLIISDIVVTEAYFVLHKIYEIPKTAAIKAILELFAQPGFKEQENGIAIKALSETLQASSKKPGMVDRMIHAGYLQECGSMLTFEKAGKKLDRVEVL